MNPEAPASPLAAGTYRLDAGAVLDPGDPADVPLRQSLLVSVEAAGWRVLARGRPSELERHPACARAHIINLRDKLLIPGLVNAHAHLDLTHIGPQPADPGGFPAFVALVRARRHTDPALIHASVREGARLSRAGGVVAIGDIGGAVAGRASLEPYLALRQTPLRGVSFLEFFAIGESLTRAMMRVEELLGEDNMLPAAQVRLGLQPHAPYSVEIRGYERAFELSGGRAVATHLAESPAEHEFVAHAGGPQRALLDSLGLWNASLDAVFGQGRTPIAHLAPALCKAQGPLLLVHLNDLSDADIGLLAQLNAERPFHVAYCPRASAYFGAHEAFGPHRYRDLLSCGINVCLGTDSIINLPSSGVPGKPVERISPLDDARLLARRDNTAPRELLAMLTLRGAAALGLEASAFAFREGAVLAGACTLPLPDGFAGRSAWDAWEAVLRCDCSPGLLC
ncbi:MAG: amidohydrolase family protein [Phycisphaerales bacterium]